MATKKTKKQPPKKKAVIVENLDDVPDFGASPDPALATDFGQHAIFRFMLHGIFPENPTPTLVRFLAMLVYTTDPQAKTLQEVSELPFFKQHASFEKISAWSVNDAWSVRRAKTWEVWHQRVIEASASQFLAFRNETVRQLTGIRAKINKRLEDMGVSFGTDSKTHELLRALVAVIKMEAELQEQAAPVQTPEKPVSGKVGAPKTPAQLAEVVGDIPEEVLEGLKLDPDEARAAAHAVLVHRASKIGGGST